MSEDGLSGMRGNMWVDRFLAIFVSFIFEGYMVWIWIMDYRSDIVEKVQTFLATQYASVQSVARDLSEVKLSAIKLGYGEPFDQEQRAINDLLCHSGASDQICLTVWAYYHDMKMNRVAVEAERRYVG